MIKIDKENNLVTMTIKEYENFFDDSLFLDCLRNAGVDNWQWYDEALEEYNKINEGEC